MRKQPLASGKPYPANDCLRYLFHKFGPHATYLAKRELSYKVIDGYVLYTSEDIVEIAAREEWAFPPKPLKSGKAYPSQDGLRQMRLHWQVYHLHAIANSLIYPTEDGTNLKYTVAEIKQIAKAEKW